MGFIWFLPLSESKKKTKSGLRIEFGKMRAATRPVVFFSFIFAPMESRKDFNSGVIDHAPSIELQGSFCIFGCNGRREINNVEWFPQPGEYGSSRSQFGSPSSRCVKVDARDGSG